MGVIMYCMDFYRDFFSDFDDELRIFILIDGLGMNLFERLGREGLLASNFSQEMRSVYPSTTAVALSSLASLREPGELGVSGWTTWLPEYKKLVNMLISRSPLNEHELDEDIVPQTLQVPSAIGHGKVHLVQPAPFLPQKYADWTSGGGKARTWGYTFGRDWNKRNSPQHWRRVMEQAVAAGQPGELIYLYLPMVDSESHKSGWDSPKTAAVLDAIDEDLAGFARGLAMQNGSQGNNSKSYNIAISADHGLINIPDEQHYRVKDSTPWMRHLESSISCEGRNPVFHVIPGEEEAFRRSFTESPEGGSFELLSPEQVVEQGYFGEVGISSRARPRWGSFIGLARNNSCLMDMTKNQRRPQFIGYHGGDTPEERRVPLISLKI